MDPRKYNRGTFNSPSASERTTASRDGRKARRGLNTPVSDWRSPEDNEHDNLPPADPARPRRKRSHSKGSSRTPSTTHRDRFRTDPSAIHSSYPSSSLNAPSQSPASVNDTGFPRASGTASSQSVSRAIRGRGSHRTPQLLSPLNPLDSPEPYTYGAYHRPATGTPFPPSGDLLSLPTSYHTSSRLAENALRADGYSRGSSVSPPTPTLHNSGVQATHSPLRFHQGSISSRSATHLSPLSHQEVTPSSGDYLHPNHSNRGARTNASRSRSASPNTSPRNPQSYGINMTLNASTQQTVPLPTPTFHHTPGAHRIAPTAQESGYADMPHPNSRPNPCHIRFPAPRIPSPQQQPAAGGVIQRAIGFIIPNRGAFVFEQRIDTQNNFYCPHAAAQHHPQQPVSRKKKSFLRLLFRR